MTPDLITYDALAAKGITLSKCQLWRMEKRGLFPRRVHVTDSRVAWVESEIIEWLCQRIAARDAAPAAA